MVLGVIGGILFTVAWLVYVDCALLARYVYVVTDDAVRIRRWIFRSVPFGSCTIPLREVQSVARIGPPGMPMGLTLQCGRLYAAHGVVLVLKRRCCWPRRRVLVTPDNPGRFMGEVLSGVRAVERGSYQ